MSRRKEPPLELLVMLPWWVSTILSAIAFVTLRGVIPAMLRGNPTAGFLAQLSFSLAPIVALFLLVVSGLAAFFSWRKRNLVDGQTDLESLRSLSWKELEWLVAEAYQRRGYEADASLGRGADGGVDVVLRKDGEITLVQCKQWKVFSVGAPVIREMFGIMTAEGAKHGLVVTCGRFTREAVAFAAGKPIELVDGQKLLALVRDVQRPAENAPQVSATPSPLCPKCGSAMILRTARRGPNSGNAFYGCSTYPTCKGTRPVT